MKDGHYLSPEMNGDFQVAIVNPDFYQITKNIFLDHQNNDSRMQIAEICIYMMEIFCLVIGNAVLRKVCICQSKKQIFINERLHGLMLNIFIF